MRKIENWLLLPVLILFVASFFVTSTLDVHLHDTYFVIAGLSLLRFLAGLLLILFGLYKTIRNRHQKISYAFAVPHILITVFLTGLFVIPSAIVPSVLERKYLDYSNWNTFQSLYNRESIIIISYFLVQVIFGIYFFIQMVRPHRLADS